MVLDASFHLCGEYGNSSVCGYLDYRILGREIPDSLLWRYGTKLLRQNIEHPSLAFTCRDSRIVRVQDMLVSGEAFANTRFSFLQKDPDNSGICSSGC